jgi:flagellar assembly protein FliH
MAFITLINHTEGSCATDQLVLSQSQVNKIESIETLLTELKQLKDSKLERLRYFEKKGYEEGYIKGLSNSARDVKQLFSQYLDSTTESVIETHTLTQQSILDLALNITRKIADELGPEEVVTGIAQRAVNQLKSDNPIEIKVHTDHAENVKQRLDSLNANHKGIKPTIEVIPDHNIGELDCVISSDLGVTEASFEKQLKSLERQLGRAVKTSNINA